MNIILNLIYKVGKFEHRIARNGSGRPWNNFKIVGTHKIEYLIKVITIFYSSSQFHHHIISL